jgi:hypothetical protein
MTFKAIAAAVAVLMMLAGVVHRAANATHATAPSAQLRVAELLANEPATAQGALHRATLFGGVVHAAKQAGRSARSHVPEPKVLLLLGLVLLAVGLRRGNRRDGPPQ